MGIKHLALLLSGLLVCAVAFAQSRAEGTVKDQRGDPLIAAGVQVKNTTTGTVTDADGHFVLDGVKKGSTLIFSSIGCETLELQWNGQVMAVVLKDDSFALDEIVVIGFGTQKKEMLTGSVAAISAEKLTKAPTDNVSSMLGGKLPGLVSRQTTGLPGENDSQIYIRGISTTGNSTPLVMVDGVERDFSNLDPSEIATITVLKDAASSAVYGVRGANGVILVTTKRGSKDRAVVNYSGALTISQNSDMLDLLDGNEYIKWHNMASDLDGTARQFTDDEIRYVRGDAVDPQGLFANTDWLSLVFKKAAIGHNHNLSVSGGTDNVRYFVGASFLGQDGIIDNVWFKRYNLRSNLDINITQKLTLKLDVSGRVEKRHQPGVSAGASDPTASLDNGGAEYGYKNIVFYAISAKPVVNPRLPDGTYVGYQNPVLARDESGFNDKDNSFVQTAATLEYSIIKGLKLRGMLSYDIQNTLSKKLFLPYPQATPQYGSVNEKGFVSLTPGNSPHLASGVNELTDSHTLFTRYTDMLQLSYEGTFGKHELSADLVWEQSGTNTRIFSAGKQNMAITEIPDLDFATEVIPNTPTGSHKDYGHQGLMLRANWSYDQKYLLQASVRGDWSAKFAKGHRLGIFPAVSLGWRLSEEGFMEGSRGWLDNLKLRASWGILGNDNISDFLYVQGIALSTKPVVVLGSTPWQGLSTTAVPNVGISWETTTTYNAGLDFSLWNGMLTFEGDAFYKVTTDILQSQAGQQPPSIGGNYSSIINDGVVDVRGFEIVLGHSNRIGDFRYDISANVSFARNRYVSTTDSDNIPSWQRKVGHPLGAVLGYVSEGLYLDETDLALSPKTSSGVRVGDIKYKDLNGDGRITAEDRTWIAGSQIPEYMFGLNLGASWKGLDMSVFFQGAASTDIMLCGTYSALGYSDGTYYTQVFKWGSNPPKYLVEGSWTPDNPGAQYPRLSLSSNSNNAVASDFWRRDASYLRLKTAQIGYTLPASFTRKFFVSSLRIYISGNNLLTFSALSKMGIDPEAPSVNNGYYPQQRVFSTGINITF
ncbi:MAG: TonB-dependent receptor [Bacteroidales bacterium]|nr:TonB-dependent receptor [Bacteroidales bacterium]